MNKALSLLRWLDTNILLILATFLLVFIPLYPKIPLADIIPGYLVRVRLEDVFILFTFGVWGIQVLRGKAKWKTALTWYIVAYLVAGLLSILSGIFIAKMVPLEVLHLGKTGIHWVRYFEYFSLFFIVISAIKSKKDVKIMLAFLVITLIAISAYGYGQKYWYWPVYSTMNREFSKGIRLYLTEHARVQSTFGGHYDLGAFLVLSLPIVFALAHKQAKKSVKWLLLATFWLGTWLIIMSAARSSFVAFVVGIVVVLAFLAATKQSKWWQKLWWFGSRSTLTVGLTIAMMLTFGGDIYERYLQILQAYPEQHDRYHAWNAQRKETTHFLLAKVGLAEFPQPKVPDNAISTDDANILVASDERPEPVKPARPSDVYVDVPDIVTVATTSATGETTTQQVERDRVYSDCSTRFGLSLCIRLDTLWPQAIRGFQRSPLFGSGYATLNKEGAYHFTEADSTDNNFLRTLGETGLLGFITYYGVILVALHIAWQGRKAKDQLQVALAIGYIAGTIGLLLNALYIDVFAASKVAFAFWSITGLTVGYLALEDKPAPKPKPKLVATPAKKTTKRKKS